MVNNNNLIIPKVEEIREIKNEVPSYEEFLKNYQIDKAVADSYQSEQEAWKEIPCYGPGFWKDFWDDIKEVVKPVATGALIIASVFPPTAPMLQ